MNGLEQHNDMLLGNRFRILGALGKGATSIVLQAQDLFLERTVAVKIPRHGILKEKPFLTKMFLKEAKYLASLEHPSVLPLYDYFDSSEGPVLITRHVHGTLNDAAQKRPIAPVLAVLIATQIASSLDFCGDQGIAHRDVKPDNVLLDEVGHAYLTDFGLAAPIDDDEKWVEPLGTPPFVSPELLFDYKLGGGVLNRRRCDQFSFGVLLYYILTGRLPFDRPPERKCPNGWEFCTALRLWRQEPLTPCYERNRELPSTVNDVLSQMMAFDPDSRFSSNREAIDRLSEALEGRGTGSVQAFMSFSHSDASVVEPLILQLKKRGISIWWDQDIVHGADWDDQIENAMASSDIMVVMVSPQSISSPEAKNEWKYWLEYIKKPLIPVVIKECRLPYRLSPIQRIEAGIKPIEELAAEVASAITKATWQLQEKRARSSIDSSPTLISRRYIEGIVLKSIEPGAFDTIADMKTRLPDQYVIAPDILRRYIEVPPLKDATRN